MIKKSIKFLRHIYEIILTSVQFRSLYSVRTLKNNNIVYTGQLIDIKNLSDKLTRLSKVIQILCEYAKTKKKDETALNIIDIGAHIGIYSIEFGRIYNNNVLSFEPFQKTFKLLEENITENNLKNIKVFNYGLLDENINLHLGPPQHVNKYMGFFKYFDKYSLGSKTIYTNEKVIDKSIMSQFFIGDEVNEITSLDKIDIIKIDVEGSELKVIQGLKKTLTTHKPILCIETNSGYKNDNNDPSIIFEVLSNIGYSNVIDFSELENISSFKNSEDINNSNFKSIKSKDLVVF